MGVLLDAGHTPEFSMTRTASELREEAKSDHLACRNYSAGHRLSGSPKKT
jgi:hypothetical protein